MVSLFHCTEEAPAPDAPAPDETAPDEPAPDEPAPDEPAPDEKPPGNTISSPQWCFGSLTSLQTSKAR